MAIPIINQRFVSATSSQASPEIKAEIKKWVSFLKGLDLKPAASLFYENSPVTGDLSIRFDFRKDDHDKLEEAVMQNLPPVNETKKMNQLSWKFNGGPTSARVVFTPGASVGRGSITFVLDWNK